MRRAIEKIWPRRVLIVDQSTADLLAERNEPLPPNVKVMVSEFLPTPGTGYLYTPPEGEPLPGDLP